jgi:hypothetical protein
VSHKPEDACRQYLPKPYAKKFDWNFGQVWCCPDCNRLWYLTQESNGIHRPSIVWKLVKGENK